MPETLVIVNTSPLLYLYQVDCLELLQQLYRTITVPPAVPQELETGKLQGVDIRVRSPYFFTNLIPNTYGK